MITDYQVIFSDEKVKVTGKRHLTIGDLVSKETVCCVGGKEKHASKFSTTRSIR